MSPPVVVVRCLRDNYAYLVVGPDERRCLVVDPSESAPVLEALGRHALEPVAVLATHHHLDHVGGIGGLVEAFASLPVFASRIDGAKIDASTEPIEHDEVRPLAGLSVRALAIPGHTLGALAFVVGDAVFTGDTLFVGGCGRLFEGTAAMMLRSLRDVLGTLPGSSRVYCGHDYAASNARFAIHVEPDHAPARALLEQAERARERGEPTVPSTIEHELAHNPFLRTDARTLRRRYGTDDEVAVFAALRAEKDGFRAS